jgi:hypothetical protein
MEIKKTHMNITSIDEIVKSLQIESLEIVESKDSIPFDRIGDFYEYLAGKIITKEAYSKIMQFFMKNEDVSNALIRKEFELNSMISIITLIDQPEYLIDSEDFGAYSFMVIDIPENQVSNINGIDVEFPKKVKTNILKN